jgi:DeoR/GlpR family transcriptional regulator of sugar metabolism
MMTLTTDEERTFFVACAMLTFLQNDGRHTIGDLSVIFNRTPVDVRRHLAVLGPSVKSRMRKGVEWWAST